MKQEPKVSKEERTRQTDELYAKIGKIVVLSEHLNHAMFINCVLHLGIKENLSEDYSHTLLTGNNLENMRRRWEALMKLAFKDDASIIEAINHISKRLDNLITRRNNVVHNLWFIGWGNESTESYEVANGQKKKLNIGSKGTGGVEYSNKDSKDFDEIINKIQELTALILRFTGIFLGHEFSKNFHYDENKQLIGKPPPKGD